MDNINYIKAHKSLALLMKNDINLKPSQKSFMDTLFCVWNEKKWAKEFLVSRDDLMESCKISNRKTYYATVSSLVDMGYITYVPSKNPEVASKFGMGKKVTSHGICHGISSGTSNGTSNGTSSVTLYKLLNNKTIKLLNENYELVNSNIEKWIKKERQEEYTSFEDDFEQAVDDATDKQIITKEEENSISSFYSEYCQESGHSQTTASRIKTEKQLLTLSDEERELAVSKYKEFITYRKSKQMSDFGDTDSKYIPRAFTYVQDRLWEEIPKRRYLIQEPLDDGTFRYRFEDDGKPAYGYERFLDHELKKFYTI